MVHKTKGTPKLFGCVTNPQYQKLDFYAQYITSFKLMIYIGNWWDVAQNKYLVNIPRGKSRC